MRVLILDDERYRHQGYDEMLAGHDVFHAYTTPQFVSQITKCGPFDLICFDHDLGGTWTGMDAAEELTISDHPKCICIVHSWNTNGARRIRQHLDDHEFTTIVAPFGFGLKEALDGIGR